ncbi:hypothetical protein ATCCBAA256_05910 [Mycobacterium montefiorense]|nr:hypothetical protein ATCCBAA256_05910 [Mycobacterium montefiorense]
MRTFLAIAACLAVCLVGCSGSSHAVAPYGAQGARLGESLALLGWNMSVSNLRWDDDYVLINVDASPADPKAPHAKPEDIRFGLYGALAHPMEAVGWAAATPRWPRCAISRRRYRRRPTG